MRRRGILRKDERGISSVIAVVSLVGIFGAAMLSLDFGSQWSTRKRIISGTDSTALDQAIFVAKTGAAGCNRVGAAWYDSGYSAWTEIMQKNTSGFEFVDGVEQDCRFYPNRAVAGAGYIGVQGRKVSDTRFGGLFGIGDSRPYSFSAARIGYPTAIKGLRPIGLCLENSHYQEWLALQNGTMSQAAYDALDDIPTPEHPAYTGAGVVHHITWDKDQPNACGDIGNSPGNWGWQDFNGDGNSSRELAEQILNGYDGLVSAPGDCDADGTSPDPAGGAGDQCNGDPGAGGGTSSGGCSKSISNVAEALRCIMSKPGSPPEIHEFPIVVFDDASDCGTGGGGGNNCLYSLARYVYVRMWGFDLGSNGYFDFEFVEGVATGLCCDTSPAQDDVKLVFLCAVDHDISGISEAERCGQ